MTETEKHAALIKACRQSLKDLKLGVDAEYLSKYAGIPYEEIPPWIALLRAEGILGNDPFQFRRHHGDFFHNVVKLPPEE